MFVMYPLLFIAVFGLLIFIGTKYVLDVLDHGSRIGIVITVLFGFVLFIVAWWWFLILTINMSIEMAQFNAYDPSEYTLVPNCYYSDNNPRISVCVDEYVYPPM